MGKATKRLIIADADVALKALNEEGRKYDVVYIDPPYDTKSRLSYDDARDDWDDFMRRKLLLTRDLMRDDAILYVSIDDNRLIDLCVLCDEIFGRKNRVAIMITHQAQRSNARLVNVVHEYVVVYAKDSKKARRLGMPRVDGPHGQELRAMQTAVTAEMTQHGKDAAMAKLAVLKREYLDRHKDETWIRNYRMLDDEGTIVFPKDLSVPGDPSPRDVTYADGTKVLHLDPLPTRAWSSEDKLRSLLDDGRIVFLDGRPYEKQALLDSVDAAYSILPYYSRQGTEDLKHLGLDGLFDTPKPVALVRHLIGMSVSGRQHVDVLDYFCGSGTTMQAVMELEEGNPDLDIGCDCVQIDEPMRKGTTPYRTAERLGIQPRIPCATQLRLDTYLRQTAGTHTRKETYEVIRL